MASSLFDKIAFTKRHFYLMGAGVVLIALGYLLMQGGRAAKQVFNPQEIFSFTRITLSPLIILAGFAVLSYGILYKPKRKGVPKH